MTSTASMKGAAHLRPAPLAAVILIGLSGLLLVGSGAWIHVKARIAQYLLEQAFAETVATGHPVKPWGWADTWPVARITVPRLAESVIALKGASGEALAFGPGHLDNTPAPGGAGTSVFAAHRDTQFAFLGKLVPGDAIVVTDAKGHSFRYSVTGAAVVRWDASGIDPHASGHMLTLTTCWPLGAIRHGPLRYVVRASLQNPADTVRTNGERTNGESPSFSRGHSRRPSSSPSTSLR